MGHIGDSETVEDESPDEAPPEEGSELEPSTEQ